MERRSSWYFTAVPVLEEGPDPEAYRDAWGGRWVGVELARVPTDALRELVLDAYCLAAPKRLAASLRETQHLARAKQR